MIQIRIPQSAAIFALLGALLMNAQPQYTISTLAGAAGGSLRVGMPANASYINGTFGVIGDSHGRFYISTGQQIVRVGQNGLIDLIAGAAQSGFSGDGSSIYGSASIMFNGAHAMAIDGSGNLYIADIYNSRVRRIDAVTGIVTTVAGNGTLGDSGDGGAATNATFEQIGGVAVDSTGNLYISDSVSHRIRRVVISTGIITAFAGGSANTALGDGGPAINAKMYPDQLAVDSLGNLYITDLNRIRNVTVSTGIITTVVGDGIYVDSGDGGLAVSARVASPAAIAFDLSGAMYIATEARIRKVSPEGIITTIAGNGQFGPYLGDGGLALNARLQHVSSIATDASANVLVAAWNTNGDPSLVLKIDAASNIITTFAGSTAGIGDGGPATESLLSVPISIAVDSAGNVYVSDYGTARVRKISAATGQIATVAGNGGFVSTGDGGAAVNAGLSYLVGGLAVDPSGNLYIADNNQIRKVSSQTGIITTIAGGGSSHDDNVTATSALLGGPHGLIADNAALYFIESGPIRKVDFATGILSTLIYPGRASRGDRTASGDFYYVTYSSGPVIKIPSDQPQATVLIPGNSNCEGGAGPPAICVDTSGYTGAQLGDGGPAQNATTYYPSDIKVDHSGNLFLADTADLRIRYISAATNVITTIAGSNVRGCAGVSGPALNARFTDPSGIAFGPSGEIYVLDPACQQLFKLTPQSTYAGWLDTVNCQAVSGWAADRNRSGQSITVNIYDGVTLIGSVLANQLRADVGGLIGDNGLHGFSFPLPASLRDGKAHNIHVSYQDNSSLELGASPKAVTCTGGYAGYVDSVSCTGISGWAADRSRPNQSLTVSLWDGTTQIASAVANGSRPDVGGVLGDNGNHGFSLQVPAAYANGVGHSLQLHYETSSTVLGAPFTLTCGSAANYAGYVDGASCTGISGWAADRNRPGQSITVSIYDGSTLLASIPANQSRGDVGAVLGDSGLHGFSYAVPAGVRDGQAHSIHVTFESNAAIDLPGSPKALTCNAAYAGYIDSSSCSGISGWIADRSRPNQALTVTLWDGLLQIATATAGGYRQDVGAFLGDSGLHGFNLQIPSAYANGVPHSLQVHYETSSTTLGSPISLTCGSTGIYAGWFDRAACDSMSGWAADRSRPDQAISVDVLDGTSVIATLLANASRPDVGAVIGDAGAHGFSVATPSALRDGQAHSVRIRYSATTQFVGNSPQVVQCAP